MGQTKEMLLNKYYVSIKRREVSTLNNYLTCLKSIAKFIMDVPEFSTTIKQEELPPKK